MTLISKNSAFVVFGYHCFRAGGKMSPYPALKQNTDTSEIRTFHPDDSSAKNRTTKQRACRGLTQGVRVGIHTREW